MTIATSAMADRNTFGHPSYRVATRRQSLNLPNMMSNGRKPTKHRSVLYGIFWIARTGAPWRDLPEEFGKWSSVYRQFRRWTLAGLWEEIMDALNKSGAVPDALQMIDSTVIRAHHQAAGAKGGLRDRVSGAQEVASRPRSTSSLTRMVCP